MSKKLPVCPHGACHLDFEISHLQKEILVYCGNCPPVNENTDIVDLAWRQLSFGKCLVWLSPVLDKNDPERRIHALGEQTRVGALGLLHLHRDGDLKAETRRLENRVAMLEAMILDGEGRRA